MKKFVWLILIAVLALALVACGSDENSVLPSDGTTQGSEAASGAAGEGASDPAGTEAPESTDGIGTTEGTEATDGTTATEPVGPTITVDVEDDPTEPAGTTPGNKTEDEPKEPTVGVEDEKDNTTESTTPDNVIDFDDLLDAANKGKG